jgi:hypothetical protein
MKLNNLTNAFAVDIIMFVDDLCATGFNFENAWQVGQKFGARLQ